MSLELGRVNVFIGENGAGKSNILEAIGLAAATQANKLDSEFLVSRGIRSTPPALMKSGFTKKTESAIEIAVTGRNDITTKYQINHTGKPYGAWSGRMSVDMTKMVDFKPDLSARLDRSLSHLPKDRQLEFLTGLRTIFENAVDSARERSDDEIITTGPIEQASFPPEFAELFTTIFLTVDDDLKDFVIYSPENSSLRVFEKEGQIQPLGVNGEGLLKLLSVMSKNPNEGQLERVKQSLEMLGWFSDFSIVEDESGSRMNIKDRYINGSRWIFDQRSANEGFLFIAFYFSLFSSHLTPNIFGIDNIDASLNPKLCRAMMERLTELAAVNNKQVVLTTHNPAILDGLDLRDNEQRLFVIQRNKRGETQAIRYTKPLPAGYPKKMSEMFMSGLVGGLPKGF